MRCEFMNRSELPYELLGAGIARKHDYLPINCQKPQKNEEVSAQFRNFFQHQIPGKDYPLLFIFFFAAD